MDPLTATGTAWRFPPGRVLVLDNGMRVRLVDMPGRLMATVALVVDLPTEVETPATEGVVSAWSALLALDPAFTGTSGASAAARLGAALTTGCDHRGPKVMADCAVSELPGLFGVLGPALFELAPEPGSFELVRRRRTAELELEQRDPFALANKLFNESVLDPTSRYARPVSGTSTSWASLCLDDVLGLQAQHVVPQRVTMTVVGDLRAVGTADIERAVRRSFERYPSHAVRPVVDRPPTAGPPARLTWRPGDGASQTQLLLGGPAVDRRDARWPAARVLAELLGGVDGLLNADLRGRLGLTYGLDAKFLPFARGGTFAVSGRVDAVRTELAVDGVVGVLSKVHAGRLDPDAVAGVRDRLVVSAPQVFESTLAVAQQYGELDSCELPASFIDDHLASMRRLAPQRMVADAATLIDPAALHAVLVGDFDPDAVLVGLPRA